MLINGNALFVCVVWSHREKKTHSIQFHLILRSAPRREHIWLSHKKRIALKLLCTKLISIVIVVLAVATVVSYSAVSALGPDTGCLWPLCVVAWGGVLVCVTISNLKACRRRKTDLVFKMVKYLLNGRNSLDSYNISYVCLCACSCFRKMLLEMPVEFCVCFIINIAIAPVYKYWCDWH